MKQYHDLLQKVLSEGIESSDRTEVPVHYHYLVKKWNLTLVKDSHY
jgi:hypothetical protein